MRKRVLAAFAVLLVVAGIAVAKRHALVTWTFAHAVGLATGYDVRLADQRIGGSHAAFIDLRLTQRGRTVFFAPRIDVWYSLRDLLPGSSRRFGLVGVDVERPQIALVRYADGSADVRTGGGRPLLAQLPAPVNGVPLRAFVRVRDGTLSIGEDGDRAPLVVRGLDVDARIDTSSRTHYLARGAIAGLTHAPVMARGTIDVTRGFAMHRFTAPVLPLRSLANALIASRTVAVLAGTAHDFDARAYAIGSPGEPLSYRYGLGFDLDGGRLTLPGIIRPVEGIAGRMALVDDAFFIQGLHARLSAIPFSAEGAIYHFAQPQIRIGVSGDGDMLLLRRAFRFSSDQPLAGPLRMNILVEGTLDDPSIVAHVTSSRLYYRGFPFDDLRAGVIYHHDIVAFVPLAFHYGGVTAVGRGSLEIGDAVRERLDLHFDADADRLPYAGALLGRESLIGDAALDGTDLRVRVTGTLGARGGIADAGALFDFGPNGVATVSPFWMRGGPGDIAGGFRLDRPDGTSAFWIDGENVRMRAATAHGVLPELSLPQMPPIEGSVGHIALAGGQRDGAIELAGSVRAGPTTIGGIPFHALEAGFDGTLGGAAIDHVAASGPWGTFSGDGVFSGTSIVARGAFDGNLDALRPVLGGVAAHGLVRGGIAVGVEPRGIVVQGTSLQLQDAGFDGVPIAHADGTLLLGADAVHVYDARLGAAGGDIVAAGSYPLSARGSGSLAFVASGLDAAALRPLGVPLDSGRLAIVGTISRAAAAPAFDGAASVAGARIQGYRLAGNAGVRFDGSRVAFDHVVAAMDGIYGFAHGDIDGVASGAPAFDLQATAPAGDIASVLRVLHEPGYGTLGTFNADVHLAGTPARPVVNGIVGIPAGSINGLPFVDGSASLAAGGGAVSAENGTVLVGSTRVGFDAALAPGSTQLALHAPSAALDDFNNYFDTGDTLAGSGAIALTLASQSGRVHTEGDIAVDGFRYRSLAVGDTLAVWSSRRNLVTGWLSVGGREGRLRAHGTIALSPGADWQATLERSRYDMSGNVDDLDVGLWVALLGFPQVPITGRAFGTAQMIGAYPALRLAGEAELRNGTFGRFPIDTFTMHFGSSGRRVFVNDVRLAGPGLTASAAGSVGLHARDPVDLRVQAQTADLPAFLGEITPARVPISGAFAGSLHVGGSFAAPVFDAQFNAQQVHVEGVPIATLFGSVRLEGDRVELYDAGATFARGSVRVAGDIPLHLRPFRLPSNTPVRFTLDASDVDASVFDALFGHDTMLGGLLATHVTLSGTVEDPHMAGTVTVAHGSYSSGLDEAPISDAAGTLSFSGSQITIANFGANAGSGRVTLSGSADLASSRGPSFDGSATLHGAQFASPVYGNATIDGNVTLARTTGNALLSGALTMTNTTIPFAAFIGGTPGAGGGSALGLPVSFDLKLRAGQNVRVRGSGYGAGLDISGTGSATLGGTLANPTLDGGFSSTNGSLTYFDRSFRVLQGNVTFNPADGIIPTLHAVATATVVNPDPDVARNPFGSATITIAVDGPVDNLKIDFTSDPSGYSREQIIAMLAPFGGFISGIQFNPYEVQIPGGAASVVNNGPVPGGVFVSRNGTLTVSQEAFSILNAQFASGLLAPVENVLGQTLGVSDVNLTLGYFGNVGVSVRRVLGKTVSAVYSSTFGLPNRQTFGVRFSPDTLNEAALSFFYQTGQLRLFQTPGSIFGPVLLGQPLEGQSGFSFTFQHFFQ